MRKKEFMAYWAGLPADQDLQPEPIPARHTGSTYELDGVRITGSREWVDAVLSRLQGLLRYEGPGTRLQVNYGPTEAREDKGGGGFGWNCYIQVRRRGGQAAVFNARYGRVTYDGPVVADAELTAPEREERGRLVAEAI